MAQATITLEDDLFRQVREAAQADGTSADALMVEAVRRELSRRFWERNKHEAAQRRGRLTEEQVDDLVNQAIASQRARKP